MQFFSGIRKWHNNKHVVSTFEALLERIELYRNKGIEMKVLGCTKVKLAIICSHKSTNFEF